MPGEERLPTNAPGDRVGTILRMDARAALVGAEEGVLVCPLRGRLFLLEGGERKPVVPGDRVRFLDVGPGAGVVEEVLPRRNGLRRGSVAATRREQVIVANLDLLVITVAARNPPPKVGFLDRALVAARRDGIAPLICVNKADLVDPVALRREMEPYTQLDLPVVYASARTGDGIEELRGHVQGRTAALLGPSGVGKSSLVMSLIPGLAIGIREVSRKWDRGVHTTSAVTLHPAPGGGHLIDTPGLRAFGLHEISREELYEYFDEIAARAPLCRFRGCLHVPEPGCAVKAAVERGEIDRRRYDSYARILSGLEVG